MTTDKPAFPSDAADKFVVRFPEGMRERIAEAAKANNRSMNAEIVYMIDTFMKNERAIEDHARRLSEERKAKGDSGVDPKAPTTEHTDSPNLAAISAEMSSQMQTMQASISELVERLRRDIGNASIKRRLRLALERTAQPEARLARRNNRGKSKKVVDRSALRSRAGADRSALVRPLDSLTARGKKHPEPSLPSSEDEVAQDKSGLGSFEMLQEASLHSSRPPSCTPKIPGVNAPKKRK